MVIMLACTHRLIPVRANKEITFSACGNVISKFAHLLLPLTQLSSPGEIYSEECHDAVHDLGTPVSVHHTCEGLGYSLEDGNLCPRQTASNTH